MDTTQASLQRGADLPVLALVLRYSVCTGAAGREITMPVWRAWPRAGAGCKFSQTVLGRRKEGRVAAEKKMWL